MKKIIISAVACASMMFAANSDYKYEITPMVGGAYTETNMDLDKDYLNAGLALGFNLQESMFDQIELGFLRSVEDVDFKNVADRDTGITRIFTNVIKEYPLNSDTSLYALVGAGLEFFDDEFAGNENGLFGNYGVGIKYKVAEEFALKFDVRHLIEADHGDNTLLYNLGFAFPFGKIAKPAPVVEKVVEKVEPPKDSDGDGVIDAKDECPNTIAGAKVDNVGCMTAVNLNINFDTDSSVIKDAYNSKIVDFANAMKNNTKLKATIEAHTDSVGSHKYNEKLSERRAASALKALTAQGVDASRLTSIGYGETKPVASNRTAEGRAENRRVTAVINK
jgi:OOP family OmpA-OmpF porin